MSDEEENDGTFSVDNSATLHITKTLPTDQLFALHYYDGESPKRVLTVKADGTIEIAGGWPTGEVAAMFWEAVLDQRINYARRFHALNAVEGATA